MGNYLVIGLGKAGVSVARLLLSRGERVWATDDYKTIHELPAFLVQNPNFSFLIKSEWQKVKDIPLAKCIVSPGIGQHPLVGELSGTRIPVISDLELVMEELKIPTIAITGSNGKSTTTALVSHIFKENGISVFTGGNFGTPAAEVLLGEAAFEWAILEVSSFQLERVIKARFHIAALLNIFPNHLDRHGSMENYFSAKRKIFVNQRKEDIAVINLTHPQWVTKNIPDLKSQLVTFSVTGVLQEGFFIDQNQLCEKKSGIKKILFHLSDWSLPGKHNLENLTCATAICRRAGISPDAIANSLHSFRGLPHRLEKVCEIEGITFFNDSKSTTPSATKVALEALNKPIILIMGGRAKVKDFSELTALSEPDKVKAIILFGESAPLLYQSLSGFYNLSLCSDLEEAVQQAFLKASKGDSILLSPGCTSWDQYKNFEERGEHFKKIVHELVKG
ncbi:UDP-N-acetylmuramoyl-L-alanine--D-glutamate ligase [Atrimonas thermophila]|uniref:UDP-N-acetylmuramoyl-L-alanine--D-glutamate ligase n=1 Tax=Atrimonas thermophila TaxID=3064161 RepID=UPI00399D25E0